MSDYFMLIIIRSENYCHINYSFPINLIMVGFENAADMEVSITELCK